MHFCFWVDRILWLIAGFCVNLKEIIEKKFFKHLFSNFITFMRLSLGLRTSITFSQKVKIKFNQKIQLTMILHWLLKSISYKNIRIFQAHSLKTKAFPAVYQNLIENYEIERVIYCVKFWYILKNSDQLFWNFCFISDKFYHYFKQKQLTLIQ